jgi:DNA-binding LacI/PurR family transcriptional regulator
MAEHLINSHKFRKFLYISGPNDNPESIDRLIGFKEYIEKENLTLPAHDILYGDFSKVCSLFFTTN